jgi:molecular chaperone DnaK
MLRVAIDLGTTSTCAAVSVDGRTPQVVVVDGAPLVPSAVYVTADGTLFVGHEADRQAAVEPSRYEPHPKRRIDEADLLLGDTVLPVVDVVRAVLRRVLHEAKRLAGGAPVDQLVLTHPADWGAARTQKLRRSAHGLASDLVLVPEPVAAAVFHAQSHAVPDGGCLAVLDLGGGTVDASVVRRTGGGFHVLGTRGDPNFGGADIDQALLEHVGAQVADQDPEAWRRLVDGRELADRRRRRVLRQDVRGAKETLSRHTYTDVPMPSPFPDAHVTRDDLERLIVSPMQRTVALLAKTVADAQLRPDQLVGVFLVGGSSRIPMVSRLLHERLGVVPVTLDQPETVVCRGALRAVMADPDRTAAGAGRPGPVAPVNLTPAGWRPVTPERGSAAARPTGHLADGLPLPVRPVPPKARARRWRTAWLIGGAVLAVTAVGMAFAVALSRDGTDAQQIAEYHYRFTVPDGWQRSGGNQQTRQVNLGPIDASSEPDQIFVRETELAYDVDADRDRAVRELRMDYDGKRMATDPPAFDGFDPTASFAGREVLYYFEVVDAGTVDWYVLFGARYQISVGCQHDEVAAARVGIACDRVVRTLTIQREG